MTETSPLPFEPVNMVEKQLVAATNGNPDQQRAFERFILEEELYVATPDKHDDGMVTLTQDTQIKLLNVPLNDGRQATAVFTSPQRAAEAFGEIGYIGIGGRTLFEIIRERPAILNPGQVYGVIWEPEAMAAMLGLPMERVIEKETQVMLGFPADPPTDLIERLKTALTAVSEVETAWLALAAWPETQSQSWYLDVRTSSPDHETIRRALPAAIEGADLKGHPVDMIINPAGGVNGAGIAIVERDHATGTKKGLLGRLFG